MGHMMFLPFPFMIFCSKDDPLFPTPPFTLSVHPSPTSVGTCCLFSQLFKGPFVPRSHLLFLFFRNYFSQSIKRNYVFPQIYPNI